jgi:2-aminoethylphosphonate-pyruvate transaminase
MKALDLYEAEGGRPARLQRYRANQQCFYTGVRNLGLQPYLPPRLQGPICVNVHAPDDPAWDLQKFVSALKSRGVVISNFYNTSLPSFRVGCIGAVTPDDMELAVKMIEVAMNDIGVNVGAASIQ